jgi:predicted transposase YbfD/YdcC
MATHALKELFTPYFDNLTDPRVDRTKRHSLLDLIVVALCATLGGANGWADIERFGQAKLAFFRTFLALPHGIPSHDTFGRVFARLDPAVLLEAVRNWLVAFRTAVDRELVAIDGKTLRGSYDTASGQSPLHLVSAWATEARLVLGQVQVSDKSNEITAIPVLLRLLDLEGCIVTIDAIGCQTEIVEAVREQEADYVVALKANQGTLYADVAAYFADCLEGDFAGVPYRHVRTVDEDHGRKETRDYYAVEVPPTWTQHRRWRDLRSLGLVCSERQVGTAEPELETRFYISSLAPKVKQFARAVRGHWGIENRLHWSLDVTFAEDQSRVRTDHGPMNLGMFRRLAISILQQDTSSKDSLRGKRLCAGWDEDRLRMLLTGFCGD